MDFVDSKCNNLGSISEALLEAFVILAKGDINTYINDRMMTSNQLLNDEKNKSLNAKADQIRYETDQQLDEKPILSK